MREKGGGGERATFSSQKKNCFFILLQPSGLHILPYFKFIQITFFSCFRSLSMMWCPNISEIISYLNVNMSTNLFSMCHINLQTFALLLHAACKHSIARTRDNSYKFETGRNFYCFLYFWREVIVFWNILYIYHT